MKSKNNILLLILLAFSTIFFTTCNKYIIRDNENFLPLLIKIPKHLHFYKSTQPKGQIMLKAWYRVSGKHAQAIEKFFQSETGMGPLIFSCCGWESRSSGTIQATDTFNKKYQSRYNYTHILISMHSDQSTVTKRKLWHTIDNFYIVVSVINI